MFGLYKELRDFGRSITACVCCFLVGGPIVLIIGIALLVSAGTDTRSNSISSYNDAVSTWKSSASSFLTNATASGQFSVQADQTRNLLLSSGNADFPVVETGSDINTYTTRSTVTANQVPGSPFQQLQWGSTSPRYASVQVSYASTTPATLTFLSLPVWEFTQQTYTGISSCSSSQQSRCPLSGGYWSCSSFTGVGYCSQWWVLSELCVVFNPGTGSFDLSAGCVVPGSGFASRYLPSAGRPVNGLAQAGYTLYTYQPAGVALPTTSLSLRVRSSQDPWLVAMRLTSGSGSFGLTTGQKVGTGIGLLVVGGIMTVLPCIAIYALLRCCEHRRISKRGIGAGGGTTTVVVTGGDGSAGMYPQQPVPMMVAVPQQVQQQYYPQVAQPQYAPQQPQYAPQQPQYAPQQPQYAPQHPQYAPQQPQYAPQQPQYAPQQGYQQQAPGYQYPQPQAPAYGYQ